MQWLWLVLGTPYTISAAYGSFTCCAFTNAMLSHGLFWPYMVSPMPCSPMGSFGLTWSLGHSRAPPFRHVGSIVSSPL